MAGQQMFEQFYPSFSFLVAAVARRGVFSRCIAICFVRVWVSVPQLLYCTMKPSGLEGLLATGCLRPPIVLQVLRSE